MSAQAAFRTKILFDTNQLLQRAKSEEEILSQTASQLMKLLNRSLIVYPEQNGDLGSEQVFGIDGEVPRNIFSAPEERDAANWTFANKKRSGAGTDSYPDAKGLYLALRTGGGVFGVIGIDLSEKPLDAFENSVLLPSSCAQSLQTFLPLKWIMSFALPQNTQDGSYFLRTI